MSPFAERRTSSEHLPLHHHSLAGQGMATSTKRRVPDLKWNPPNSTPNEASELVHEVSCGMVVWRHHLLSLDALPAALGSGRRSFAHDFATEAAVVANGETALPNRQTHDRLPSDPDANDANDAIPPL